MHAFAQTGCISSHKDFFLVLSDCSPAAGLAAAPLLLLLLLPPPRQLVPFGERTTQPTCYMYIVRSGLLGSRGRVCARDSILGEDVVCRDFERQYNVMALTFVSTLTLSARDLHEIMDFKSFAQQRARARRVAIVLAIRQRLSLIARVGVVRQSPL